MKNLKKYVLGITLFCLVGCQPKPEVLFENIYIGDNLETCLAKGTVQNNPDYNKETVIKNDISMIELANNHIADSYFTKSEVIFDGNNIIKEIVLKFQQDKKGKGKTAKEVFNYMTQYFCQRYQGMKTETIDEEKADNQYKEHGVKFSLDGMANIWETSRIKMTLKSYDKTLIDRYNIHKILNSEPFSVMNSLKWWDIESKEGKWVELNISVK